MSPNKLQLTPEQRRATRHAVIHTAAIDVRILRIEQKQVTLSVFRQLKEQSIFDPASLLSGSLPLIGQPWGTVRYTWGGCPKWTEFHLVWQLGSELRRMPLVSSQSPLGSLMGRVFGDEGEAIWRVMDTEHEYWRTVKKSQWIEWAQRADYGHYAEMENLMAAAKLHGFDHEDDGFVTWKDLASALCKKVVTQLRVKLEEFEQLDQLYIAV